MALIDQYAGLDHKAGMDGDTSGEFDTIGPYYSDDQERRLRAYTILRAMVNTKAREFGKAPPEMTQEEWEANLREFGDAAVIAERIAAGVLGDTPTVGIVGADEAVPDRPLIPEAPTDPATTDTEDDENRNEAMEAFEAAIYQTQLALWQANAQAIFDQWVEDVEAVPDRQARQQWLQDWAAADEFIAKMHEMETEWTVPLGDSVVAFGWNPQTQRPESEIFAPDTYMPVLNQARTADFPKKVHLVIPYEGVDESGEPADFVRRITYELVPIVGPDIEPGIDPGPPLLYLEENQIQTETCLFSDRTWEADDFKSVDNDEDNGPGVFELIPDPGSDSLDSLIPADRIPLGLDFIPVVHFPNTLSRSGAHFGRSPLIRIAQLLDEIAGVDTDESLACEWAARPPVAMSGIRAGTDELDLSAGKAVALGDGGNMHVIDMAQNLGEIGARLKSLLRRVSVNAQVPEGLLGRVDASDVPSGIAFTLSFTAFEQLIERLRMARQSKASLALKMVQRIAIQNADETIESAVVYPAEVRFGPFMPQDMLGVAQIIKILWDAKAISQETALAMAQEAGIPSENLDAELSSIRGSAMMTEAAEMLDATGSHRAVFEFIGRQYMTADDAVDPDGDTGPIDMGPASDPSDDLVGAST